MDNKQFLNTLFKYNSHMLSGKDLDPFLFPFILGSRNKMSFLNLGKILPLYKKSLFLVREIFSNRGKVILIIDKSILSNSMEPVLNRFFIVIKNGWPEGSVTNISMLKKACNTFNDLGSRPLHLIKGNVKKQRNQVQKFFKKYQTIGFVESTPRLVISFSSVKNTLFFQELSLLNIPVIAIMGHDTTKSSQIDYPVIFNDKNLTVNKIFLRMLILEAQKGKNLFLGKFRVRKLSRIEKESFLKHIKIIL